MTNNSEAKVSSFSMGDGPLSISLNIYDGKTLKEVVHDLLLVVKTQGETIASCTRAMGDLEAKVESSERRNAELMNSVNNLAQNVQGFVDNEPVGGGGVGIEAEAKVESVGIEAGAKLPSPAHSPVPSRSVTPVPDGPGSPTADSVAAESVRSPSPVPESVRSPSPAPGPVDKGPMTPARLAVRKRFQKGVKKIIVQNRMKSALVGVLTSRAAKGMSVAERLKSAEDAIFRTVRSCETLEKELQQRDAELRRYVRASEASAKKSQAGGAGGGVSEGALLPVIACTWAPRTHFVLAGTRRRWERGTGLWPRWTARRRRWWRRSARGWARSSPCSRRSASLWRTRRRSGGRRRR
jgi:hypothetical protein